MYKLLMSSLIAVCSVSLLLTGSDTSTAAEWGTLKGRFVVDGKAPEPPPLAVDDKDPFCQKAKPENKSIVVGKGGGLANVVVYLRMPRGQKLKDIHPDYAAQLNEPIALDNENCSFVPHVTLVRVGQTLLIKNSDPTGHNTNMAVFEFNRTITPAGESLKISKDSPVPAPVQCNIHPFMKGYVLSQDHPYMAVSGDDGTFEITNVPAGKHEFQFWHEGPAYLRDVKFKGGPTNRQGRATLAIAAGQTLDLGDIKVPASMLKPKQ